MKEVAAIRADKPRHGFVRFKASPENIAISDEELFSRIAKQRVDALSTLYDRYASILFGLACKILGNKVQAEDVLQELFISLWQNAHKFDKKRGASIGWLTVLCRNRCIDMLRAGATRRKYSEAVDEAHLHHIPDKAAEDPFQFADYSETRKNIRRALQRLPVEQREPIIMAYFEGLSQNEIASKLKLPLGTVKTRIRLGMQKLRISLIAE